MGIEESNYYPLSDALDSNSEEGQNINIDEWEAIKDEKNNILLSISGPLEAEFNNAYSNIEKTFNNDKNNIHKTTDKQLRILGDVINKIIIESDKIEEKNNKEEDKKEKEYEEKINYIKERRETTRNEIQIIKDEEYKLNPEVNSITNKSLFLNTLEGNIMTLFKYQMSKGLNKAMKTDPGNPDYINQKYIERLDTIKVPIPKKYLPTKDVTFNVDFSSNILDKELKGFSAEYNLNKNTVFEGRISTNGDFYIGVKIGI